MGKKDITIMKSFSMKIIGAVCLAALCMGFASCSGGDGDDDIKVDGKVNALKVFKGGLPKRAENLALSYDSENRLVRITGSYHGTVTFEYSDSKTVKMYCGDDRDGFNITVNDYGFASYMTSSYGSVYNFAYNNSGQIQRVEYYCEGDSEPIIATFTYSNGDLVKSESEDFGDNDKCEYEISYSSYENKGCILCDNNFFSIGSSDPSTELEHLYYAGLLGKPSAHLPKSAKYKAYYSGEYSYDWTLDSNGYPTKMIRTDDDGYSSTYSYVW